MKGKKTGGRTAGTPNRLTTPMRRAILDIIAKQWPKVEADLAKLKPKDRLQIIVKLLPFVAPQFSSVNLSLNSMPLEDLEMIAEFVKERYGTTK